MKIAVVLSLIFISSVFAKVHNLLPEGRIAGGYEAKPKSAPFIVSIQLKSNNGFIHYCGGSIIDANWILTAAHCLYEKNTRNMKIEAGRHNLKDQESTAQQRTIDSFVIHKLYTGGVAPYDIALIYTNQAFIWTDAVKPAMLPSADKIPSGNVAIYGWGSTSKMTGAQFPDVLQTAVVKVLAQQECKKLLGNGNANLHDTNMCTASPPEGVGVCSSDSGGPLVSGKDEVIGVVSWGEVPCGKPYSPSVYVRVSAFVNWISEKKSGHKVVTN
uniref:Venom polypeptide n=1 Tax=Dolopus genitalis TaxID=2488630 RepID=A0A3G5BIM5_DOLGE|nr:venom polypeptide [Dolopus genitalis]